MNKKELSPIDLLQEYITFCSEVSQKYPFYAIMTMSYMIEFMGKCINDSTEWDTQGQSKKDFNIAITELEAFKEYRQLNESKENDFLYNKLRCGFAHLLNVKADLLIINKGRNKLTNEPIIISCDQLLYDCKEAIKEIGTNSYKKNLSENIFYYTTDSNGSSITGSTINNVTK